MTNGQRKASVLVLGQLYRLKLASGVSTAVLSAMMAMEHRCVSKLEGIIDEDVDRSIQNLTAIGREGMNNTDTLILDIMTGKC